MKKKILSFITGVTPKSKATATKQPQNKADLPETTPPDQFIKTADTSSESKEPIPETVNPPANETDKATSPGMTTQA